MKTKKIILFLILAAFSGGLIASLVVSTFQKDKVHFVLSENTNSPTYFASSVVGAQGACDLTAAAEKAVHAVVHVEVVALQKQSGYGMRSGDPLFDFFFGPQQRYQREVPVQGSGSGVIITSDGYIVTNNHVIKNATEVKVTLNDKQEFIAKIVGADPSTDIALIKVDAEELPFLPFGDSESLKLGEWVLAVGNPYNLTSTVTSGIISAKARNVDIIREEFKIESFIQTDAAVNPGNSGGALVNANGDLVGINTAIASQTGAFQGYAFAVPSNIAKRVVEDLIQFGSAQRGFLGISYTEITQKTAEQLGLKELKGVYVGSVQPKSAAETGGIKVGDVILKINGVDINTSAEMQGQMGKYRPNDKLEITVKRGDETKVLKVTLDKYDDSKLATLSSKDDVGSFLGADFKELTSEQKRTLGIMHGVQVATLKNGRLKEIGVREGFIITHIDKTPIRSVENLQEALNNIDDGVLIKGIYPNGKRSFYALGI